MSDSGDKRVPAGRILVGSVDLTTQELARIEPQKWPQRRRSADTWLTELSSALLRVPSMASPESWHYLLNPLHPDAGLIVIEWTKKLSYDRRLFDLAPAL